MKKIILAIALVIRCARAECLYERHDCDAASEPGTPQSVTPQSAATEAALTPMPRVTVTSSLGGAARPN
jgi:hypothetical protein